MKPRLLDRLARRLGFVRAVQRRSYAGAAVNRLTSDWLTSVTSADAEIRSSLKNLRSRSRELERNNDYARRYFQLLDNNVLGAKGIRLQSKVLEFDGTFDKQANDKIELAWWEWGQKANCTVSRSLSWLDFQKLALRSAKRDGAFLCRKVRNFDNPFQFALQDIEIDRLDIDYEAKLGNGHEIKLGIEYNAWAQPVAYHLLTTHPGDLRTGHKRERIPAEDMIHLFNRDRSGQSTGVPETVSAMTRLHQLGGYEEAEVIAAREGACKGGFFTAPTPEGYTGEDADADGNQISNMEPGMYESLGPGWGFTPNNPTHPTEAFADFVKAMLRGAASGLGISYNALANDLEGVNFSSIRAGLLEDREHFKMMQEWLIEHLIAEVFAEWLPLAIVSGQIKLPISKITKFQAAEWKPRRWPWVDPEKDVDAKIKANANGLESKRSIISEAGGDIEDVFNEIAEDEKLAKSYGLVFGVEKEAKAEADHAPEPRPEPERNLTPGLSRNGKDHQDADPLPVLHR